MGDSYVAENARERERLKVLAGRLTDAQMEFTLANGWTIAEAFAHLAFWDQYSLAVIHRWKTRGVEPVPVDFQVVNESLLPLCRALPPRAAADLAVQAAEAIDREIESLSSDLVSEILAHDQRFRLYRSDHRRRHLDAIEKSISSNRDLTV